MAIDIGIAGFSLRPSPVAYFDKHEDPTSLEARRTWLACFVALSSSSKGLRRPNVYPWNSYHQDCLVFLKNNGEPSDLLLCQIVRIEQLIQEISSGLGIFCLETFVDGNDHNIYATVDTLKAKVDMWASEIPPSLASSPTLKVWYHVAMVLLYELVLHTPTNKPSFSAPFIPERIPYKDIPKPSNIILQLRTALQGLVYNCHAVVNAVAEMDAALVLNLPVFSFSPNIVYTLFVLVTAMVAATDPENTHGQCLSKESFHIEECSLRLGNLSSQLKALDPTFSCFTTRLVDATNWIGNWYTDYTGILQRYQNNLVNRS